MMKALIWTLIFIALFKIYEHSGFNNAVTLSVLLIIFGLWFLFRIELNEDVEETINSQHKANDEEAKSEAIKKEPKFSCNTMISSSKKTHYSSESSTDNLQKEVKDDFKNRTERKETKKSSKYGRLVRARSRSRSHTPERIP